MNDLGYILDDCLRQMREGSSADECLARYPEHAPELEPLLRGAHRLRNARAMSPSTAVKAKGRALVMARARSHPPRRAPAVPAAWRMAVSLAVLVIVLMLSTTAFAQSALPGQALYGWKLSSEQVWRAVASDRVGVDLVLADRRTDELTDVAHDPSQAAEALNGLHDVLGRLQAEDQGNNGPRIQQALEAHQKKLSNAGIQDKQLEGMLHGKP